MGNTKEWPVSGITKSFTKYGIGFDGSNTKAMLWDKLHLYILCNFRIIARMTQDEGREYFPHLITQICNQLSVWTVFLNNLYCHAGTLTDNTHSAEHAVISFKLFHILCS